MTATAGADAALHGLYDSLARYQWWRRRLRRAPAGTGLEMHKVLAPAAGEGPGPDGLHAWLWRQAAPPADARIADVGCGLGASVLHWAKHHDGGLVGCTPSAFQARCARREARRTGLDARCRFEVRSFDDPLPGPFDRVFAVESLFHARDLPAVMRRIAAALVPGGVLALVEDMAVDGSVHARPAARSLAARWCTPRLPTVADFDAAVAAAGLEPVSTHDLTGQVRLLPDERRNARARRLGRLRAVLPLPGARRVVDAFLGGLDLERLYLEDAMRYRALVVRRGGTTC